MFGILALLAAAGDVRLFLVGGLTGNQRLARHLWRMCMALTIAASAFFLGQARLLPEAIRESQVLTIPVLLAFVTMIFWLVRLRWTSNRTRRQNRIKHVVIKSAPDAAGYHARLTSGNVGLPRWRQP